MYGFDTRAEAQRQADRLTALHPEQRFEVALHKHREFNIWTGRTDFEVTYGVKRFVPYCDAMPERFDGFVWFDRKESR